jgi:hypothetical protein
VGRVPEMSGNGLFMMFPNARFKLADATICLLRVFACGLPSKNAHPPRPKPSRLKGEATLAHALDGHALNASTAKSKIAQFYHLEFKCRD